jgi:hypothetical protein
MMLENVLLIKLIFYACQCYFNRDDITKIPAGFDTIGDRKMHLFSGVAVEL